MSLTSFESSGAAAVVVPSGTLAAQATSAFDAALQQRLCILVPLLYIAVVYEDVATPNHASRLNYLKLVVTNPMPYVVNSIVWMIVTDGVTDNGATDQALANRFGDILNVLSHGF
jgi:hypothetical protein